jgi:hypothetical protein
LRLSVERASQLAIGQQERRGGEWQIASQNFPLNKVRIPARVIPIACLGHLQKLLPSLADLEFVRCIGHVSICHG